MAVGYMAVNQVLNGSAHFDKILSNTANNVNKTLPKMVDSATRLDTTIAGPGKKFTYVYTLVNVDKSNPIAAALQDKLKPQIVANYKTSEKMKVFRDENVELDYQYKDKNGDLVCEVAVSPKDF